MVTETNCVIHWAKCVIHWTRWITQFFAWPSSSARLAFAVPEWLCSHFFFLQLFPLNFFFSFFNIKSTIKIVVCCCCCNRLRVLIYSIQELVAVAYDAVQIIKQAQNIEPCLSINGSAITSEDRDALFSCMTKVILNQLFWIVVQVFKYVLIFLPFPYFFFFHHNVFMNKLCRKTEVEHNPHEELLMLY